MSRRFPATAGMAPSNVTIAALNFASLSSPSSLANSYAFSIGIWRNIKNLVWFALATVLGRLRRSPLECLSHPALLSTCCEWQWAAWHCSGVIPSLMRLDCQLQAFNAEVTSSPTIALSPCPHSCPPTLVPLFGDDGEDCSGWRTALSS